MDDHVVGVIFLANSIVLFCFYFVFPNYQLTFKKNQHLWCLMLFHKMNQQILLYDIR